jgi:type II secretory pathway pseudopilin PulG
VRLERQRANTLIEVAVAIAVIAIAAGAALSAFLAIGRHRIERDRREALEACVRRELSTAVDIVKYSGGSIVPASVATSLPMPGGSPLAAVVSLATHRAGGAWQIDVSVQASGGTPDGGASQRAELRATVAAQAPVPGSELPRNGLVPAPPGAP